MSVQKQLAWYANLIMNVTSLYLTENHLPELIKYAQAYSEQDLTCIDLRFTYIPSKLIAITHYPLFWGTNVL